MTARDGGQARRKVVLNPERCLKQSSGDQNRRQMSRKLRGVHGLEAELFGDVGPETERDVPQIVRLVEVRVDVRSVVGDVELGNRARIELVRVVEIGDRAPERA